MTCQRADGRTFVAKAKDISMGGMYLEATESLAFAEELTLDFKPVGVRIALKLPAVVRWTDPAGFGVQFGLMGARETHAISELVRR